MSGQRFLNMVLSVRDGRPVFTSQAQASGSTEADEIHTVVLSKNQATALRARGMALAPSREAPVWAQYLQCGSVKFSPAEVAKVAKLDEVDRNALLVQLATLLRPGSEELYDAPRVSICTDCKKASRLANILLWPSQIRDCCQWEKRSGRLHMLGLRPVMETLEAVLGSEDNEQQRVSDTAGVSRFLLESAWSRQSGVPCLRDGMGRVVPFVSPKLVQLSTFRNYTEDRRDWKRQYAQQVASVWVLREEPDRVDLERGLALVRSLGGVF